MGAPGRRVGPFHYLASTSKEQAMPHKPLPRGIGARIEQERDGSLVIRLLASENLMAKNPPLAGLVRAVERDTVAIRVVVERF